MSRLIEGETRKRVSSAEALTHECVVSNMVLDLIYGSCGAKLVLQPSFRHIIKFTGYYNTSHHSFTFTLTGIRSMQFSLLVPVARSLSARILGLIFFLTLGLVWFITNIRDLSMKFELNHRHSRNLYFRNQTCPY